MGSIGFMDPKPPLSCWYMSWPRPQPIAQNRLFKSCERGWSAWAGAQYKQQYFNIQQRLQGLKIQII